MGSITSNGMWDVFKTGFSEKPQKWHVIGRSNNR
jgi:hypothetical protein